MRHRRSFSYTSRWCGLPDDNLFGGQKPRISDSIGPVVVAANKLPSNLQSYNVTETEKRFNPDTLEIELSEKIKTDANFSAGSSG